MLDYTTVDRLLFDGLDYCGESADLIVVLGSLKAPVYRIPVAVRLYEDRKAEKMLLCGGSIRNFSDGKRQKECEAMKFAAVELGVRTQDIFTEDKSNNTVENLMFAKTFIREQKCKAVILVTTAYHLRRATKLAEKILDGVRIIPCPANCGSTRRDNWNDTEKGRRTALDECLKFGYYIRNGFIDDFTV